MTDPRHAVGGGDLRRAEFDLCILAPNGLRRGRTTGSCATAAVTAALAALLRGRRPLEVEVVLPDDRHYLVVPIERIAIVESAGEQVLAVRADVRKDGGDDPDSTHGATIFAQVRRNDLAQVRFIAGPGVGTATRPGLRVAVGEAAINPVPRAMMRQAVAAVAAQCGADPLQGYDLTIGCEDGERIARKTFNPRLGIAGGISILGTSGIVEPMSMASWVASVEVYVRVALADALTEPALSPMRTVAYLPGKIGRDFAADVLGLPERRTVQIANFLGDALDFTQAALSESGQRLAVLWLAGHPGKLAKVLDFSLPGAPDSLAPWVAWDAWNTHSGHSPMAMDGIAGVAAERGFDTVAVTAIRQANTVEAAIAVIESALRTMLQAGMAGAVNNMVEKNLAGTNMESKASNGTDTARIATIASASSAASETPLDDAPVHHAARAFWTDIEHRIARRVGARVPAVERVQVRLFDLAGNALGQRACV